MNAITIAKLLVKFAEGGSVHRSGHSSGKTRLKTGNMGTGNRRPGIRRTRGNEI